jgi:hypothetical protein
MAKERSWYVESKVFEMLIKGGNSGLRIVEKSKRKQGSIFLRRDELAWVVGAVEEVLDVDTTEVYWDPASAGFPRILVQRRSNRHGGFIIMEEFEGSSRRGSVLIPEGRYGQGWTRLLSELRNARRTIWKDREFKESKAMQMVTGRSYAEVVGRSKFPVNVPKEDQAVSRVGGAPAVMGGDRAGTHSQRRPESKFLRVDAQFGTSRALGEAGEGSGDAPEKPRSQAQEEGHVSKKPSLLSKNLQYPGRSGVAAMKEGTVSERDGQGYVQSGVDLQEFTNCLMDIKRQLELGLLRVEQAFQLVGLKEQAQHEDGPGEMGCGASKPRATQSMGREVVGWSKPKKKNFKGNFKSQHGLLGPKPIPISIQAPQGPRDKKLKLPSNAGSKPSMKKVQGQGPGPTKTGQVSETSITPAQFQQVPEPTKLEQVRVLSRQPAQRLHLEGESSDMGAARATGVNGSSVAGVFSGEQIEGGGVLFSGCLGTSRDAEMTGEPSVGTGLREETSTQRSVFISERAEGLGGELSSPMSLISVIPESANRGEMCLSPVRSSKRLSDTSEAADEVGLVTPTPEKQSKQMKVFFRRDSPSAKIMKSWVAERVPWNGGRDCVGLTEAGSGKDHDTCVDSEAQTVIINSELGEPVEIGCMGGMGNQEEERQGMEGCVSRMEEEISPEELLDQGMDLESHAAMYMKMAWAVKEPAGLTCGGQEGKLKQVFGQIVADKFGEEAAVPTGVIVDGIMGLRDEDCSYEA